MVAASGLNTVYILSFPPQAFSSHLIFPLLSFDSCVLAYPPRLPCVNGRAQLRRKTVKTAGQQKKIDQSKQENKTIVVDVTGAWDGGGSGCASGGVIILSEGTG